MKILSLSKCDAVRHGLAVALKGLLVKDNYGTKEPTIFTALHSGLFN